MISVLTRSDINFFVIYEFVFDRFRAIRQDLVIQRCYNDLALSIYKKILKFYLLADYK
jgi:SAC3 domain-containing protein 1